MLDPPPPVAVHGPGGRHEAVRHGLEVLLGVVQAEDDPAGSDPAQRQAFGTEIVLQHPVIARGLAVADGPDGGHVRDAERQPLIGQAAVETPRTFVQSASRFSYSFRISVAADGPALKVPRAIHVSPRKWVTRSTWQSWGAWKRW
jgi:hypothetical protein